jgi:hypothetical protein
MTPRSTTPVSNRPLSSAAAISRFRLSTRSRIAAIYSSLNLNSKVSMACIVNSLIDLRRITERAHPQAYAQGPRP